MLTTLAPPHRLSQRLTVSKPPRQAKSRSYAVRVPDPPLRLSRESIRARLSRRALIDPGFRTRLAENPVAAAIELGISLPPDVSVVILEEPVEELRVVIASPDTKIDGLNPLMMRIDPAL